MKKNVVHELLPFDTPPKRFPVYIAVLFQEIEPMPYSGIFHYHEEPELIFCHSGKMQVTLPGEKTLLNPGDFLFINSNTPHATDPCVGKNQHFCIKFDVSVLNIKLSYPMPEPAHYLAMLPDHIIFKNSEDKEQMHALFQRCLDNYSHDNFTKRLILNASIMEIIAYIFDKGLEKPYLTDNYQKSEVLLDALDFIDQNIATVTLDMVAKHASISYSYFSLLFKRFCGISFPKYVSKARVKKSLPLLTNSSLSITEIATECGFSNLSHYVKCFKAEKGIKVLPVNHFRDVKLGGFIT